MEINPETNLPYKEKISKIKVVLVNNEEKVEIAETSFNMADFKLGSFKI